MKKILLTSAGFEIEKIKEKFLELVNKKPEDMKVLFVTTAAVEVDAIFVLPKCLEDLLGCGIDKENITVYDMHKLISEEEIRKYDAIYVCGGKTSYLVDRINEVEFKKVVENFINQGGIYIGVSAGSVACSKKYENGLNFIENILNVHCEIGSSIGKVENTDPINLTNNQAILILDDEKVIFE